MTDFGASATPGGATAAEQDETQVKLEALHTDLSVTIPGLINEVKTKLDTLHTDLGSLHSQAIHTLVDNITFNDDPTTYESDSVDSEHYRDLSLLVNLTVVDTPGDIVIRLQESDDDAIFHTIMNGPFGDLRYENAAGAKTETIHGRVSAPYLRAYVAATGTDGTHKFTLTLKLILTK